MAHALLGAGAGRVREGGGGAALAVCASVTCWSETPHSGTGKAPSCPPDPAARAAEPNPPPAPPPPIPAPAARLRTPSFSRPAPHKSPALSPRSAAGRVRRIEPSYCLFVAPLCPVASPGFSLPFLISVFTSVRLDANPLGRARRCARPFVAGLSVRLGRLSLQLSDYGSAAFPLSLSFFF